MPTTKRKPIDPDELKEERTQLVTCRVAFLLLCVGIVLHIFSIFAPAFVGPHPKPGEVRTEQLYVYALGVTNLLLTALPASILLWRNARSDRWKHAARLLFVTVVVDLAVLVILAVLREPGKLLTEPEPLGVRVLIQTTHLLSWLSFWWIAVLAAEFSLASRSPRLVLSTEHLGYVILGGLSASIIGAAWSLPAPIKPGNTPDSMQILLQLAEFILVLVVLSWEFRITWMTSVLARLLARHCDEMAPADAS